MSPVTLAELERAIRDSWGPETADPREWKPANPSSCQCAITMLVVNDYFGGELLSADVFRGGEPVDAHMWNRLPSGLEIDLTREQFRDGETIGPPRVRDRPTADPTEDPLYARYELLRERVRRRLEELKRPRVIADRQAGTLRTARKRDSLR
jgi:hypothetical protein